MPRPTECGTWPTNILARLETPTSSSSPAASLALPDECGKNLFHLTSSASGDVLADYSHRGHRRCVHQLLTRPRSTRQQVAHIHSNGVLCRTVLSISSSNASWSLCRRAIAGVVGRPQCTINDSLSFSRRPARPAHRRRRLAPHRKIYSSRPLGQSTGSFLRFGPVFFVDTLTHTVRPRDGFRPAVGRMGDTLGHTSAAGTMRGRRRARGLAT